MLQPLSAPGRPRVSGRPGALAGGGRGARGPADGGAVAYGEQVPTDDHDHPPPAGDVEAALILRIQNGDTAAFNEVFHRMGGMLLAVVVRIVRDRALAEEVLQECFVELWKRSDRFDPQRGSGRGWLVGMCRRRAIDCVRSVQAARDRDAADAARAAATPGQSVEQTVEARLASDDAARALAGLPGEQAEPIYLSYFCGLSHEQIARRLDRPLGTVKTRIRDGMKKLRFALGEGP
ncbi:RNA polymerase sigma factor [Brevibacterium rongguiense]|uniref:RNA polymerase sigma factor n=1 Tax=Brevibacterium rongguiense TaxID=2695267 RepID=UPI002E2CF689|nr:sigma-70 family RNA polymerase sigma factor [Brevibacterium rongguiense]